MDKIRNKLIFSLLLVALVPVALIGGYGLYSTTDALRVSGEERIRSKVTSLASTIERFLENVSVDLFNLRDSSSVSNLYRALASGASEDLATAKADLAHDFLSLSSNRGIYHQIRFIDTDGMEIVRVDRVRGVSRVVADEMLQNKKGRYYFDDTVALSNGGIMISPLDLNREQGKIEKPLRPTIRYATPVYDESNNLRGILILNVLASRFLELINRSNAFGETQAMVDTKGFYLAHVDPERLWGSSADLGSGENLSKDDPELAAKILGSPSVTTLESGDALVATSPVYADRERKRLLGTIIDRVPNAVVYKSVTSFKNVFLMIALLAIGLTIGIALLLASSIANPIIYLTRATNNMSKGELDKKIEVSSTDETRELASAIERLRRSMKILMEKYS
ncbi:MAG TPA: HAMP domain-containing protein [Gammaproteobacteria bacterium]|nr:HAMP domain-containing protein [Gammaproteobacteria bacterium]